MRNKKILIGISLVWGLLVPALVPVAANPNPGVLPPKAHPFGHTYGEWSAAWWQWAFSLPIDAHPLFDTEDCSAGQSGKVFFLGGTLASTEIAPGVFLGKVSRQCRVPTGKALFFPIANIECSTIEGNGEDEKTLSECATFLAGFITDLEVTVDGVSLQGLDQYQVQSPLFVFGPLPDNNILESFGLDAPAGATSPAVSDGVFLMLAPLCAGSHTIHFTGALTLSVANGDPFDLDFRLDITYHVTVAPGAH